MKILSRRRMAIGGVAALVAGLLSLGISPAQANTTPIALPSNSIVPTVLTAGYAEKSSNLTVFTAGPDAYFWVDNFNTSASTLRWVVSASASTTFSVTGLFSAPNGTALTLTNSVNGNAFTYTTTSAGWARPIMGTITVPAGTSNLTLTRSTTTSTATLIKALELIPQGSLSSYNSSVTNAKASSQWLTDAGYGIFLQYGGWGYPKTGSAKSLDAQACDFNVQNFVNMVQSVGAKYVIWSYTWFTYEIDGPNTVVDSILGNGSLTASCNLNLQVAQALKAIGVKFILYYHMGHDDINAAWWAQQDFPTGNSLTGNSNKTAFLQNWTDIITYVGNQFGNNLDGWWFDDGSYYYPLDFAAMETAARAGNPSRIFTVNSWYGARFTDYQDYQPGEVCNNGLGTGTVNSSGVYSNGPYSGVRAHCQFMMNQNWGVNAANTTITAKSTSSITTAANNAKNGRTALSLNLMMWEDGAILPATYQQLQNVNRIYNPTTVMSNDNSSQITYTGTWAYATGRTGGDYQNDIHHTSTTGSAASITFSGTGIDIIGPSGPGYGAATVTIDGVAKGTYSQDISAGYNAQQVLYSVRGLSAGTHTIVLTKTATGTYFQVDAFNTVDTGTVGKVTVNDTGSQIAYGGTWGYSSGRTAADYQNDVHFTETTGSTATITFTGTTIDVLGPTASGYSSATVTLDGVAQGAVTQNIGTAYAPQQVLFTRTGLSSGSHTLVFTRTNTGTYFQIDAFRYTP